MVNKEVNVCMDSTTEVVDKFKSRVIFPRKMKMSIPIGSMICRVFFIPSMSIEEDKEIKFLMVDTGYHAQFEDIISFIDKNEFGISRNNISHILLTHAHLDHVGCVNRLQRITKARVIVSDYEAKFLENGENSDQVTKGLYNKVFMGIVGLFVESTFEEYKIQEKDIVINLSEMKGKDYPLYQFGARILHLPGHTPGSLGLYLEDTKELLVGDLIVGDMSEKKLSSPTYCYSEKALRRSYNRIRKLGFERLYPTHIEFSANFEMFEETFKDQFFGNKKKINQ